MTRPSPSDQDPRPPTEHDAPPPYVVSPRTCEAIEHLGAEDTSRAAEGGARPLVGVVADVRALRRFAQYCLSGEFDVIAASHLSALAEEVGDRTLRLVCLDLYTLDHQSESDLAVLTETFADAPVLILSQERVVQTETIRFGRACTVLPLPAAIADVRRLAAALVRTRSPRAA